MRSWCILNQPAGSCTVAAAGMSIQAGMFKKGKGVFTVQAAQEAAQPRRRVWVKGRVKTGTPCCSDVHCRAHCCQSCGSMACQSCPGIGTSEGVGFAIITVCGGADRCVLGGRSCGRRLADGPEERAGHSNAAEPGTRLCTEVSPTGFPASSPCHSSSVTRMCDWAGWTARPSCSRW